MKNILLTLTVALLAASCGGSKGPDPTPAPKPDPVVPKDTLPAGTLYLKLSTTEKSINSNIFGYNTQTIKGPYWNNDPLFLNSIAELDPGNFRYPGGTVGNFWDWKTGDYMAGANKPIGYRNGTPNYYKLDDVKKVYDRSGGHCLPVYMINPLTSNLEYQLASLKYAQSIGLPVTCIEMGNELYLDDPDGTDASARVYMQVYPDVKNYADTCLKWTQRFRQEFPQAQISLIGVSNPTAWSAARTRVRNWNASLMSYLMDPQYGHTGIQCDAITVHDYAKNNFATATDMKAIDMISAMTTAAGKVLDPSIDSRYRLWITEYGMESTNKILSGSWAHGLGSLLMSAQLVVTPRVDYICFFDLSGSQQAGALYDVDYAANTDGTAVTVRKDSISASGRAMILLALAQREASSVCTADFMSVNPQVTANPQVQTQKNGKINTLYAYRFRSNTTPAAVLVNIGDQPQKVSLNGLGFRLHRAEQLWAPTLEKQITGIGDYQREYTDLSATAVITLRPFSATLVK